VVGADEQDVVTVDVARWSALAEAVLADAQRAGELTLTFVDGNEMAALNAEHMGAAGPTDVLSFPLDDELALLVVHGVLHVLGHDHVDAADATAMRERERALLRAHHWHGAAPIGFRQEHA